MKAVLSGKEMKAFDTRSIRGYGIPSLVLMERAALAVAEKVEEILKKEQAETVWSVCGFGNNGADGVAAARMLFLKGYDVKILFPGRDGKGSEELEAQLNIVKRLGIPVMTAEELPDAEEKRSPAHPFAKTETKANACRGVILDAVFGIGLSRNVEGAYKKLIDWINRNEDLKTIAVDIPSGISSDTGEVMGDAVRADVTVTFGMKKLGQVLFPGREYCGELLVRDVGFVPGRPFEDPGKDAGFQQGNIRKSPRDGGGKEHGGSSLPLRESGIPDGSRTREDLYTGGKQDHRPGKTPGGDPFHLRCERSRKRSGELCEKDRKGDGMGRCDRSGAGDRHGGSCAAHGGKRLKGRVCADHS